MTIKIPRITHFPSLMFAVIDLGHKVLRVEEIQVRLLQTSGLTRSGHPTMKPPLGSGPCLEAIFQSWRQGCVWAQASATALDEKIDEGGVPLITRVS